jgi:large conductance mechanosensitive channel
MWIEYKRVYQTAQIAAGKVEKDEAVQVYLGHMFQGFKQFILKGNVVDLAVGIVVGVSFGNVVTAFVKDLMTPLIGAFGGQPDFSSVYFTINSSKFLIGDFLNTIIAFLINATVIYFFVVLPVNKLVAYTKKEEKKDPTTRPCPECLSTIPVGAKRCSFCTSVLSKK